MDLQKIVKKQMTKAVIDKISKSVGLDSKSTNSVIEGGLPAILEGLKRNARKPAGAQELDTALREDHDGSILEDLLAKVDNKSTKTDGGKILEHIFGSKKDDVAETVGSKSGVDKSPVIDILSTLAPIVLGQLGKTKRDKGLNPGDLTDLLKNQKLSDKNGILGALTGFLDKDNDGSIVDDLIDMGKGFLNKKK